MQCPSPAGTVRDLRRNSLAAANERPRTNANETEMETTRAWYRWKAGVGEGNVANDLSANYVTIYGVGLEALAEA